MSSPATRSHVRHAGDDAEFYAEQDRKKAERRAELEAGLAKFEEENPDIAIRMNRRMRRRFR